MRSIIIFYKGLLEECDKEESLKVTGAAATSCFKIITQLINQITLNVL